MIQSGPPAIDVIILSLDRGEDTVAAIESALAQEGVDLRIYVVDQGSADHTLALIRKLAETRPELHLEELGRNIGVPGGRNLATRLGSAPIVVSLDNDAEFEHKATLATVAAYMNGDPSLAAAGFRIMNHFTGEDDWGSWCYPPELKPSAGESFYAVQFCGCGHAIRRSAFEQVGGYEEDLFFIGEEIDLAYRMLNRGYRIKYLPDIRVRHKVAPEQRVAWGTGRFYYAVRNSIYFQFKFGAPARDILAAASGWIMKGAYNGIPGSALRGVADAAKMCRRFARSRADRSMYRLRPSVRAYIGRHAPKPKASIYDRLQRQFVRLGSNPKVLRRP